MYEFLCMKALKFDFICMKMKLMKNKKMFAVKSENFQESYLYP